MRRAVVKKLTVILLLMVSIISLAGCAGRPADDPEPGGSAAPAEQKRQEIPEADQTTDGGNYYTFEGVRIPLPDGFSVDGSSTVPIAYPPEYPEKTDNINFTKAAADDIAAYTRKEVEQAYSTAVEGFEKFKSFEKKKIDGTDAVEQTYDIQIGDIAMEITQVVLFLEDKTISVTYSSVSGEYDTAFAESVARIRIQK